NLLFMRFFAVNQYRISEYFLHTLFSDSFSEVYKVTWIKGKSMFKMGPPAEVLHVRIPYPGFCQCLISQIVNSLEHQTADHQTNWHGRTTSRRVKWRKLFFKIIPVYFISQKYQFVSIVNKINQHRTE